MKKATKIIILIITIVISGWSVSCFLIGAYFKLTHIPGADSMLIIGLVGVTLALFFLIVYKVVCKKNSNEEK